MEKKFDNEPSFLMMLYNLAEFDISVGIFE